MFQVVLLPQLFLALLPLFQCYLFQFEFDFFVLVYFV